MRAKFITFEGGEGTGKSTQTRTLAARLDKAGIAATLTREPGGAPFAEQVRALLLNADPPAQDALAETLLFYGARAEHLAQTVRPALASGRWVICDRFSDSTRVYQGAAGGVDAKTIALLDNIVVAHTQPDLTIILDLPARDGMARAASRARDDCSDEIDTQNPGLDNFESRDMAFHDKLRNGFLQLANDEPDRCVVIDAACAIDDIADQIWAIVQTRLLDGNAAAGPVVGGAGEDVGDAVAADTGKSKDAEGGGA